MEYKQTKAYMLHKLNTAFESFTNLSSYHIDNHKTMIEFFESNSNKIKAVSLEHCKRDTEDASLLYTFVGKGDISHNLYVDFFDEDYAVLCEYLNKQLIQNHDFFKLQDLKDFLKTEIFN